MAAPTSEGNARGVDENGGKGKDSKRTERAGLGQSSATSLKRKRGLFSKELKSMMYGYGDDPQPLPETVQLVEDILVDYITDMTHKAQELASMRGKPVAEDILFLIRKDPNKLDRANYLLDTDQELKNKQKIGFDLDAIAALA